MTDTANGPREKTPEEKTAEHRAKCLGMLELGDPAWLFYEEIVRLHQPADPDECDDYQTIVDWRPRVWWPDNPNDWDEEENRRSYAEWMLETGAHMFDGPCDPECYDHHSSVRWNAISRHTGKPHRSAEPVHSGDVDLDRYLV